MSNNIGKKITLNPEFLSLSGAKKTHKKREKQKIIAKPNSNHTSKTMRKKLIEKIKNYQSKCEELVQPPVKESSFDDEFSTSLDFLQNLSDKKKQKKNRQKSRASTESTPVLSDSTVHLPANTAHIPTNTVTPTQNSSTLPPENIPKTTNIVSSVTISTPVNTSNPKTRTTMKHNQPEYSCLKNGSRPTFREWKKMTQRHDKQHVTPTNIKINLPNDNPLHKNSLHKERSEQLDKLKEDFKQITQSNTPPNTNTPKKKRCVAHRKIKTVKYKLGKSDKGMSVLVKNTNTRRRVKHEISLLRQKAITEVKQYLRDKNLLKIGSDAPKDVLRQMYEQAVLSGDLNNNNDDTLMHNFMQDK